MNDAEGAGRPAAVAYVGAGSNIDPAAHLREALRRLEHAFGPVSASAVYRSEAVGFDGNDFLNLVAAFRTTLPAREVVAELDRIEAAAGRRREGERFAARTLDLDLLMYDDAVVDEPGLKLPRDDILEYAFVLGPLAELAPELLHPVEGVTMRDLWRRFDGREPAVSRLSQSPL